MKLTHYTVYNIVHYCVSHPLHRGTFHITTFATHVRVNNLSWLAGEHHPMNGFPHIQLYDDHFAHFRHITQSSQPFNTNT